MRTANQPESTGFESWRDFKRRNDTGSSRIPSPLAHHARPVRQYRTDATLSRLLSPSPPIHGSGCLQLHPAATTARRWTVSHLHMDISASWRTETSRRPGSRAPGLEGTRPRGAVASGGGIDACAVQDCPDGGGADLVAEAGEFAVDAAVAPGGVLGGQAEDQCAQAGGDGRSNGSGRLGCPAAGDQLAVPGQDGGGGDE